MANQRRTRANAVRPPMTKEEFDRLGLDQRGAAILGAHGVPLWTRGPTLGPQDTLPSETKSGAASFRKADVRRALEAARAAGFEPDELVVGGIVMRRRGAASVAPAAELDEDAEIALWAARHASQ